MTVSGDLVGTHGLTRREALRFAGVAAGCSRGFEFLAVKRGDWLSRCPDADSAGVEPRPGIADRAEPLGHDRLPVLRHRDGPVTGRHQHQSVGPPDGPPLMTNYACSELLIENTGHVVEVVIPAGFTDTLRIGHDTYQLEQYHFHAPSEHAVNGHLADLEAHFVHKNAQGDTAVVGRFFRKGPHPDPLLTKILFSAPITAGDEVTLGEANPTDLLPSKRRGGHGEANAGSFFTYDGSLATPGCTEPVRWFVLSDVGHVSPAALERFHFLISLFPDYGGYRNNNRPVQPLNGRVVSFQAAHRHRSNR